MGVFSDGTVPVAPMVGTRDAGSVGVRANIPLRHVRLTFESEQWREHKFMSVEAAEKLRDALTKAIDRFKPSPNTGS